ncbi:threonine--tRNA ligase [Halofilum ochraceum]|uniref:threonine--tRNA ligase n=1 Tax=Halofilum ochraceum TaxID=1611323 RepID=UPI0008D985C3|nr:threonine--tRNA ligase [Halofilum ochraceum]
MPEITLPDGSRRHFDQPVTVADVAADIGPGLAKAAVGGRVDGELVDTDCTVDHDAELAIVTPKDEDGLHMIRHSTAHLMAQAVQQLYPEAQVTIGPVIEDGFYYDFAYERSFTPEDLEAIEARMTELAQADIPVERSVMDRDEAIAFFLEKGEKYKAEIIREIPQGETISLYRQDDFIDLCRGPHVPSTGRLGAFKLTKVAGAYWRGDSNNEMLQRIYGTAWPDKKQLKQYLHRLEEAAKRDHRKLGRQLDLFHFQEDAPGMVFWHERGWALYRVLEDYMRARQLEYGYEEVHTPQILDRDLWKRSGHWDKFRDNMFSTSIEDHDYAIKPMNCPGHVQLFNQGLKSYRDLPEKIAEFGVVHRNEASGTLHGLMRARRFTQDDAHVFCTEDQLQAEIAELIDMTLQVYGDFGFDDIDIALSLRPPERVGSDAAWDRSEQALKEALDARGLDYVVQPGEGAFYGPKIEFVLKDCLNRAWQCGTIQLDFSMPGRLGAQYVDEHGEKKVPVMIHRAILGSMERFIGILIEHFEGRLPTWLAPAQAVVLNITDDQAERAREIEKSLKKQGIRAFADLRNEKIGYKIREHTLQRIPYMLVIGQRELETGAVAVRTRDGQDLGSRPFEEVAAGLAEEDASHGRFVLEGS